MRKNNSLKLRLLAMLGVAVFFLGCKDEKGILGLDVQPGSDKPLVTTTDTLHLKSYIRVEDSLRSDETLLNLVGAKNDVAFGKTVAGFYTQVLLSGANIDFGNNPIIDSVVFGMQYEKIYGDSNAVQTFELYELSQDLEKSEIYYTNFKAALTPALLGSTTTTLAKKDSIYIQEVGYGGHVRIPLDNSFGQKLLDAADTNLTENAQFLELLKGFFITVSDSNIASGQGAIATYDMLKPSSGLFLYFHTDEDTTSYHFEINNEAARIGVFNHDFSGSSEITNQLADSTLGQQNIYIQGMSSLKGIVELPDLQSFKDSGYVINRAKLYLPIENGSNSEFEAPGQLALARIDTAGTVLFVVDQFEGGNHFGGTLSDDETYYEFNITRHVNQILNDKSLNFPLVIQPATSVITSNRLILSGAENNMNNLRLHLTITKP